jgi:hypothetical protein
VQRRDKPSSQDVIVPLAQQLVAQGEKLLVFRNMRGAAQARPRSWVSARNGGPRRVAEPESGRGVAARVPRRRHGVPQHQSAARRTRSHREGLSRPQRRHPCSGGDHDPGRRHQYPGIYSRPRRKRIRRRGRQTVHRSRVQEHGAGRAGRLGYNEIGKAIILAGGWGQEDGVRSCNPTKKPTKTPLSTPFPDDPRGSLGTGMPIFPGATPCGKLRPIPRTLRYGQSCCSARVSTLNRAEPHGDGKTLHCRIARPNLRRPLSLRDYCCPISHRP